MLWEKMLNKNWETERTKTIADSGLEFPIKDVGFYKVDQVEILIRIIIRLPDAFDWTADLLFVIKTTMEV